MKAIVKGAYNPKVKLNLKMLVKWEVRNKGNVNLILLYNLFPFEILSSVK